MYFRARYYNAQLGQFISRDPLGYVDGMSQYRGYFVPGGVDPEGTVSVRKKVKTPQEARDRCQKIKDLRNQRAADEMVNPVPLITTEQSNACHTKIVEVWENERARGNSRMLEIWDQFGPDCSAPQILCKCCGKGSAGSYNRNSKILTLCWNNLKDDESEFIKTITHEGVHALQNCYWKKNKNNCTRSLYWELEAYYCEKECTTFEECMYRALASSCGGHCKQKDFPSDDYFFKMKRIFDGRKGRFCQFPRNPYYPPKAKPPATLSR